MSANPSRLSVVRTPAPNYVPTPPSAERWFTRDDAGNLVFTGETYDDHLKAWNAAQTAVDAGLWGQAMVAASLDTKHGKNAVEEFAKEVRRSPGWIWGMAKAYRVFEFSSQLETLSFTHHVEAARADDPHEALAKAAEKGWNCKELQGYAETGLEPERKESRHNQPKNADMAVEAAKLHGEAVQKELASKMDAVKEWPDSAVTPLLAVVYRRISALLEWQKNRTVERDCLAVMEVFNNEEGYAPPNCASFAYIQAWLSRRGWFMTKKELEDRMATLKTLHMLTDNSRKGSKGATQRGVVTPVYDPCFDYATKMEEFSTMSPTDRRIAIHLDWVQRARKYAPELLPKQKAT